MNHILHEVYMLVTQYVGDGYTTYVKHAEDIDIWCVNNTYIYTILAACINNSHKMQMLSHALAIV